MDTNKAQYPVSGTCDEANQTVTVKLADSATPPNTQSTTDTCDGSSWSVQADVASFIDGEITIVASYEDPAGNPGKHEKRVQQDTGEPDVQITTTPNILFSTQSNYILGGTCSEDGQEVSVALTHKTNTAENMTSTVNCGHITSGNWQASFDTASVLSDGTIQITATHRDQYGNTKTLSADTAIEVTRDTVLPEVHITTANDFSANSDQTAIAVSGTCSEDNREVTVAFTDDQNVQQRPATQPTCAVSGDSGTWSTSVDATSLDLGPIVVTAAHQDAAGNSALVGSATMQKTSPATTTITDAPISRRHRSECLLRERRLQS